MGVDRNGLQQRDPPFLRLFFEYDDDDAALTKTHFKFENWNRGTRCIELIDSATNRYEDKSRGKNPVPWTPGVMAHMWYFVTCATFSRGHQGNAADLPWLRVAKGTPVASIHELARKSIAWRSRVFGNVAIDELISLQQFNEIPHRRLNESLLPADSVFVFLDGEFLETVPPLEALAHNVLRQFNERHHPSPNSVPVRASPLSAVPDGPADVARLSRSRLRLRRGDTSLVFETRSRHITIGRSPNNDVTVSDPDVSWEHGVITLLQGSYRYRHLSNTNPTVLRRHGEIHELATSGGREEIDLRDQDRLAIGGTTLVVELDLASDDTGYKTTRRRPEERQLPDENDSRPDRRMV